VSNEDCAFAGRRLFAVADGMGGLPAGEVASELAIRALRPLDGSDAGNVEAAHRALLSALEAANEQIRGAVRDDPTRTGMGTTLTALLAVADRLAVLHVGDSRAYLYRDGELIQLTTDDTYVQMLLDQGALTEAEAAHHPQRYLVTQAVQGEAISPACTVVRPRSSDRFLVCSDGLSDYLAPIKIKEALATASSPQRCARRLIDLVLDVGAPDNVTVIVVDAEVG
jgi:protein phosphatase